MKSTSLRYAREPDVPKRAFCQSANHALIRKEVSLGGFASDTPILFRCPTCSKYFCSFCEGCADDFPDLCDTCAVRAMGKEKTG